MVKIEKFWMLKRTMKKSKTDPIPFELSDPITEEETQGKQLRRNAWLLVGAVLLIALLIWSLSRNQPKPNSSETVSQGEVSPDAVIEKVHLVSTVQGIKRWELYSDIARVYQIQKEAYLDNIYTQYYKKDKLVSTLTADKAVINTDTNATQAQGHVELVVENGSKLETDKLNWDQDTDQLKTDSHVHIYKGSDEITAVGMVADTELNNIHFVKDVHTRMRDTHEIMDFQQPKPF